jgi:hypothetical protein
MKYQKVLFIIIIKWIKFKKKKKENKNKGGNAYVESCETLYQKQW